MSVLCDMCNEPMKLASKQKLKKKEYNWRRWYCELCGLTKSTFGGTDNDEKIRPLQSVEDVEKQYRQEKRNRE